MASGGAGRARPPHRCERGLQRRDVFFSFHASLRQLGLSGESFLQLLGPRHLIRHLRPRYLLYAVGCSRYIDRVFFSRKPLTTRAFARRTRRSQTGLFTFGYVILSALLVSAESTTLLPTLKFLRFMCGPYPPAGVFQSTPLARLCVRTKWIFGSQRH